MAVFKDIATWELVLVLLQFLLGNSFLLLRANPDSSPCCSAAASDLLYPRLALLGGSLLLTTVAAATILLYVRMALSSAEAKAATILLSVLRAVSSARPKAAAAYKQGVAATGRKLRALLLLAIALSAASTILAVPTFETGYDYRKGCVHSRDRLAVVAVVMMAIEHGCAALLVAVAQD